MATSTLDFYMEAINETPLLTADQERRLARQVAHGDQDAREHFIHANLRLVVRTAKHFLGRGLDIDDLIAEGNLGLMRAVALFDEKMKTRFSTYAVFWIAQAIRRGIQQHGRSIRVPVYILDLIGIYRRVADRLAAELGRPATHDEIAKLMQLPAKQTRIVRHALLLLSAPPRQQPERRSLDDMILDASEPIDLDFAPLMEKLRTALASLPEQERHVLTARFGVGREKIGRRQLAEAMGLPDQRVKEIELAALKMVGERMEKPIARCHGAKSGYISPASAPLTDGDEKEDR